MYKRSLGLQVSHVNFGKISQPTAQWGFSPAGILELGRKQKSFGKYHFERRGVAKSKSYLNYMLTRVEEGAEQVASSTT